MTESTLSALTATPLAAALTADAEIPLTPYSGVLTLEQLDAPEAETAAFLEGVAVHDLGWQRRIAVRGEDRARWLSGMVTNAVESLPSHSGAYNLVLNAQGRIQGDAIVWRGEEAGEENFDLELEASQSEALLAHLDHFIIMDDVELVLQSNWTALGLAGPKAPVLLASLGLPIPGADLTFTESELDGQPIRIARGHSPLVPRFTLWIENTPEESQVVPLWQRLIAAGASPVGANALETLRILEGTPSYNQDIQSRDLAQETSLTRALNFTKGCYLGQEIVERVRSRGQVHRHLRQLEILPEILPTGDSEIPAPGTELQLNGKAVGTLTSVTRVQLHGLQRIFAIGMIRAEAELTERNGTPLDYQGGQARLLQAPPQLTSS